MDKVERLEYIELLANWSMVPPDDMELLIQPIQEFAKRHLEQHPCGERCLTCGREMMRLFLELEESFQIEDRAKLGRN